MPPQDFNITINSFPWDFHLITTMRLLQFHLTIFKNSSIKSKSMQNFIIIAKIAIIMGFSLNHHNASTGVSSDYLPKFFKRIKV